MKSVLDRWPHGTNSNSNGGGTLLFLMTVVLILYLGTPKSNVNNSEKAKSKVSERWPPREATNSSTPNVLPSPPPVAGGTSNSLPRTSTQSAAPPPPRSPVAADTPTKNTSSAAPRTPATKSPARAAPTPTRAPIQYPPLVEFGLRNKQFFLKLNENKWNQLRDEANEDPTSFNSSVAFLGKTQNGKSFLIREIAKSRGGAALIPNIATGVMQAHPTSSGISPFRFVDESNHTTYYLDYEGEEGGLMPLDESSNVTQMDEVLQKARRDITRTDLRRFAYVTSNVIVYITSSPLSNVQTSCYDILDFASEAVNAIGSAERPSLLIIFNKQFLSGDEDNPVYEDEIEEKLNYQKFTEEFFNIHDPERTLLNYFHEVIALVVPAGNTIINYIDESNEVKQMISTNLMKQQIGQSIHLLDMLIENKWHERLQRGNLYNEATWLILLQIVLQRFYSHPKSDAHELTICPIRMSSIFAESLISDKNSKYIHEGMRILQEVSDSYFRQCLALSPMISRYSHQKESIVKDLDYGLPEVTLKFNSNVESVILSPTLERIRRYQENFRYSLYALIVASIHYSADACSDGAILRSDAYTRIDLWPQIVRVMTNLSELWEKYYRPCLGVLESSDNYHSPICCDQVVYNHSQAKHQSDIRMNVRKSKSVVSKVTRTIRRYLLGQSETEVLKDTTIRYEDAVWSMTTNENTLPPISMQLYPEMERFYNKIMHQIQCNRAYASDILLSYHALITREIYSNYPISCTAYLCHHSDDIKACLMCLRSNKHKEKVTLSCHHHLCKECYEHLHNPALLDLAFSPLANVKISEEHNLADCYEKCPFCRNSFGARVVSSLGDVVMW